MPIPARVIFSITGISSTTPRPFLSSGTKPIPARMASAGLVMEAAYPSTTTSPATLGSTPNSASTNSVRPAPTNPAMPSISPAFRSKLISDFAPVHIKPRTDSTVSEFPLLPCSGKNLEISRPTISFTISSEQSRSLAISPTLQPSRSTMALSHISCTSPRRCEI